MQTAARRGRMALSVLFGGALALGLTASTGAQTPRPNFLIIVADDMGYSDVGAFGGEIDTPTLDALARSGLRLTGFHTAPTCAPTRAMLLTGADNHEVGMGAQTPGPALRQRGYEGELNEKAATVAEVLQANGYFTAMTGKWHMGESGERSPRARGFDRSFALLQGGGNHYGRDQAGEPYRTLNTPSTYREDGQLTRFPVGRYSNDVYTEHMLAYLQEARAARRPFFAYLAYTAPHWPLQAPEPFVAKYRGQYDLGYEVLRTQRIARMKALGLIDANITPHEMVGVKPWAELSIDERAVQARSMEIYAAMVDHLDVSIGRVIADLKANGQYDNTVILFFSDNGADGSASQPRMPPSPEDSPPEKPADNSLGNMGKDSSYVFYGPGWAQAGTAPSRLMKGRTTQGGIHTPALIAGPGIPAGGSSDAVLHVSDIAPTVFELAGARHPERFGGRNVLPVRGKSWAGLLQGRADTVREPGESLAWELSFNRAIRQGDWKAVYVPARPGPEGGAGETRWELFNLGADPGETTDLAAREPRKLEQLVSAWHTYAREVGVVIDPPPAATGRSPSGE